MYTKNDLCIVIIFFNGEESIIEHVKILKRQFPHLLIINNGSGPTATDILVRLSEIKDITIINNKTNMGIGYALNQALEYALHKDIKLLLTLDQDSEITEETILKMLNKVDISSKVVSVGPYYGEKFNNIIEDKNVKYLITSGNIIDVHTAFNIGGFNSALFIDCVDIDFSFNLLSNNYRMMKVGGTFMHHKIGEVDRSRFLRLRYLTHSPDRYYYNCRNNVYIYRKYFRKLPVACIKLFLSLWLQIFKIIFIEKRKAAKLLHAKKGIIDGFKIPLQPQKEGFKP